MSSADREQTVEEKISYNNLSGAEIWTLQKNEESKLKELEMNMEKKGGKSAGLQMMWNEEALKKIGKRWTIL